MTEHRPLPDIYDTDAEPWWDDDDHAFKGMVAGVCLSVPLWIVIGAAVVWVLK